MADDTAPEKPAILTRQELYDRVWATPLIHLAKEFETMGSRLANLCSRHAIPYPPPRLLVQEVVRQGRRSDPVAGARGRFGASDRNSAGADHRSTAAKAKAASRTGA